MRGHKKIHKYRTEGFHPSNIWVFVAENPERPVGYFEDPENLLQNKMPPEVWVYPEDSLDPLNFRFAFGSVIHLYGNNEPRVRAVARALSECMTKKIIISINGKVEFTELKEAA